MATRSIQVFGLNVAIPTTTEQYIATSNILGSLPDGTRLLRVKAGGHASDTADGLGVREITVYGLDETGVEVQESFATAGALASANGTQPFSRINFIKPTGVGIAYGTLGGDMTIESTTGAAMATLNYSDWQGGNFTVPLGWKAYLRRLQFTSSQAPVDLAIQTFKGSIDSGVAPFANASQRRSYPTIPSGTTLEYGNSFPLDELEVITLRCYNAHATLTAVVQARMDFDLFQIP